MVFSRRLCFALGALSLVTIVRALTPQDRGIRLTADVSVAGEITLRWPSSSTPPTQYQVYRRGPGEATPSLRATLGGSVTSYTDTSVSEGTAYDYEVRTPDYNRFGILRAGRDVPLTDRRGVCLLVVDETQASALSAELDQLRSDWVGDGWTVVRHDVPRDDLFVSSGALQRQVKASILAVASAHPGQSLSVYLIGRVPVPYSGYMAPDGHPNHVGAWPADVYYGELNGVWTDTSVSTDVAGRRRNMPGDGKFDPSSIPTGTVEAAVGRVDFSQMPAFAVTETELLRRYLNKAHAYRWAEGDFAGWERRALVRDGFGDFSGEAFAANGWRNFSAFFGTGPVVAVASGAYFSTLANERYLWSYACGGGSYTSASGVGSTADFAATNPRTVFTLLFGSYFGDWDSTNNFLRAPLATSYGLASLWAGRPNVYLHRLAMGETLGDAVRTTWEKSGSSSHFERYIHTALMGDPGLRLHVVAPPAAISAVLAEGRPRLAWSASSDPAVSGYYVYRALDPGGPFTRVSGAVPWAALAWDDDDAPGGRSVYYMLRAAKRETSASGTYWNASQGLVASVTTLPDDDPPQEEPIAAYPNPWRSSAGIPLTFRGVRGGGELSLYSVTGELVRRIPVGDEAAAWDGRSDRSEERRVGKECRRLCRSRWSPYH
jgi:hypothetical protein